MLGVEELFVLISSTFSQKSGVLCVFSLFLQAKQAQEGQEQQKQVKLANSGPLKTTEGSRRPKKTPGGQEEQGEDRNQVERQQTGQESGDSGHPPIRGHQEQQQGKVPHFFKEHK